MAAPQIFGVSADLKDSPLRALHEQLGGRMVPFAGWNMPVVYRSILDEHHAVRREAGIFDISHMGQFFVRGAEGEAWLNRTLSNDLTALDAGQGQYSFLLNERGGVIDDLIVYRQPTGEFFMVVNAAKIDEDYAWMKASLTPGAELIDESSAWAGMALQGPAAARVWAKVYPGVELPPRNGILQLDEGAIVCRTGYTGEDGLEFFCPAADGATRFSQFVEAGAMPCGLGARDTLRLEMCYPLNGSDLSAERTPLEAGLAFAVNLKKGEFCGRERLLEQKEHGVEERLFALEATGKGAPPRAGYAVLSAVGDPLGTLTSGALSPSLGRGIALAYLPRSEVKIGSSVQIDVRGRRFPAVVVKKPFYKPPNQQG